ncbi:MAG: LysM peptidoglycan-binding domain-containing protein [Acidobacteriota bacterium]
MEIYIPQVPGGGGQTQGSGDVYTIQPGDTLESIAALFAISLGDLVKANFKDGAPGQLNPGQEILIPIGDNIQGFVPYIIQVGDTLDSIAAQFGLNKFDILRANPPLVQTPLLPGSTVKIPQFTKPTAQTQNQPPQTYTMKLGDTLTELGKRFNVPTQELVRANPQIPDPDRSYPGKTINFPNLRDNQIESPVTQNRPSTSTVSAFALDNLSKVRFQLLEAQQSTQPPQQLQQPQQLPLQPGFGIAQQSPNEQEGGEAPTKRKRKTAIPAPFDQWASYIYDAAEKYDIEASLIAAVIWRESGGNNIVAKHGHGYGLMQIDDRRYGQWLREHQQGLEPASNIDFGAAILRTYLDHFQQQRHAALAAFCVGVEAVEQALQAGRNPDSVTTGGNYAFDILTQQEYFKRFFED